SSTHAEYPAGGGQGEASTRSSRSPPKHARGGAWRPCAEGTGRAPTRRAKRRPVRAGERGVGRIRFMADPTGFEPAISSVTGWHVGPLHHGSERRTRRIPDTSALSSRADAHHRPALRHGDQADARDA